MSFRKLSFRKQDDWNDEEGFKPRHRDHDVDWVAMAFLEGYLRGRREQSEDDNMDYNIRKAGAALEVFQKQMEGLLYDQSGNPIGRGTDSVHGVPEGRDEGRDHSVGDETDS
jgi:hypothetical protein